MDRDRAEEILGHLHDAADALECAETGILEIGETGRKIFGEAFGPLSHALHFELLQMMEAIFQRYPDLKSIDERHHDHHEDEM
ncbi:MAG: hypothetical protein HY852_14710 [Bradyrhizobium sp.]|uniref:hypothetical protein n=1 Tax=Bradyrhizobium sp. TaxID=376 RepID=UPI0025BA1201|nr:hypothetical protein [Bradyrhizobium sp.]MBI5263059.1 hypothetical protein [Bradyrhizobium sp.]